MVGRRYNTQLIRGLKPYKWRRPSKVKRPDVTHPPIGTPPEDLVGHVHGQPATDIEERAYNGLLNNGVDDADIEFQTSYIAGRNVPGEIRPDFVVHGQGLPLIIFIDGEYFHKSAPEKQRDRMNDAILFQQLGGTAQFPVRVPGDDLETQEMADATMGEVLRGRRYG